MQGLHFIEHGLQSLLRAVRAVFLSIPIAGILVALATEVVGFLTSHQLPPSPSTHIYALVLALVVSYAVALTYAVIEIVSGAIKVARVLEQDIQKQEGLLGKAARTLERTLIGR